MRIKDLGKGCIIDYAYKTPTWSALNSPCPIRHEPCQLHNSKYPIVYIVSAETPGMPVFVWANSVFRHSSRIAGGEGVT